MTMTTRRRRTVNTHINFKSTIFNFSSANDINGFVEQPLKNQRVFKKRMIPHFENNNNNLLTQTEIDNFTIDVEKIDRLYHVRWHANDNFVNEEFELICRLEYEKKSSNTGKEQQQQRSSFPVFIKMLAHSISGIFAPGSGSIYIGTDADVFMNMISMDHYSEYCARKSLVEDGLIFNEYLFNDLNTPLGLKHVRHLKLISLYKEEEEFKSLDYMINNTGYIHYYIGRALAHQHTFDKYVIMTKPSFEKSQWWDENPLENFKIDANKIDILYYIDYPKYEVVGNNYELICRMKYLESFVYIKLVSSCCECKRGFACWGKGEIFVSEDDSPVLTWLPKRKKEKSPHTLQYLCHLTVCENINNWPIQCYYRDNVVFLPKMLKDSVKNFILPIY